MKDTHNIILILVSSKWLILSFRVCPGGINSWLLVVHLSSGVLSFPHYLVAKLHLNHRKASPCVFNFSFFLSSFYYRSSSWRLYMVVHQGFLSFFNCSSRFLSKLWPAKLYSKINMVLNTCLVLRSSSILHLAFWGAILLPYLLRWCYVTLDNFLHVSWFICCQEWGILNPSISSLELSWYRFHLKPSLRNVAFWCLLMTQVISFPSWWNKFSSLR